MFFGRKEMFPDESLNLYQSMKRIRSGKYVSNSNNFLLTLISIKEYSIFKAKPPKTYQRTYKQGEIKGMATIAQNVVGKIEVKYTKILVLYIKRQRIT